MLPDRAGDAPGHRHGRVVLDRDAALAPDLDLRLPHPRGRLDRRAGARVHAQGRLHLRRAGDRAWARRSTTFAPRLSFFFNAHIDFFEEIAKYRAARRIWAREMRDTYGARDERSQMMRFHTQTAGVSLTAQQPLVNIVRTTIEALAGVLGGHPVAAHQLLRRGAGAADRRRGADRAAHPAGDRPRVRGHQHRRPARRLLLRRAADRRARGAPPTSTSRASTSSAAWSRRSSSGFPQREIADAAFPTSAKSIPSSGSSSGSTTYRLEDERGPRSTAPTRRRSASRRARLERDPGGARLRPPSRPPSRSFAARPPAGDNLMPR